MKKVKLPRKKRGISSKMPRTLEYGVWYNLITPFDWQYFKIKKGSRYVSVYDFTTDKIPQFTVSKKKFLQDLVWYAKSAPTKVKEDEL